MIGVIANPSDEIVVREFFELFKTPWEFYCDEKYYDVVLGTKGVDPCGARAKLILIYSGSSNCAIDHKAEYTSPRTLLFSDFRLPIYGQSTAFDGIESLLKDEQTLHSVAHSEQTATNTVIRIGYDLFGEIRTLLEVGQPIEHAESPTLELHIAILRELITANGIPLVEVPPVPNGYQFIACLTHDMDHPSIRLHKLDHTMLGFSYRALVGSLIDLSRGRLSLRKVLKNWMAVLKLPFVFMGIASDFWSNFDEAYSEIENGLPSTYFVIPVEDSGRTATGLAPRRRAAGYSLRDVQRQIKNLSTTGHEIGAHGINAWLDSSAGCEELQVIRDVTGAKRIGLRMHWLYFEGNSPARLEQAGASYDSTIGYNETIGYRAGTTQAYVPLETTRLIELPMHVMDTALFYPSYLDLSPKEAMQRIAKIVDNAARFGGVVTVNWHDRSTAPERQWGEVYSDIVNELRCRGAWFATADQVAEWFRKRRSVVFDTGGDKMRIHLRDEQDAGLPALSVRSHGIQPNGWSQMILNRTTEATANCRTVLARRT